MHYIREYGQSGFKVEMYNIYCSIKEVLSCLYILSHWTCTAIMIWIVTIDYKIDEKTLERYCIWDDDGIHCLSDYTWESIITHSAKLSVWFYTSLAIYFLAGLNNTVLAVELFRDRGRVPDQDGVFAKPDYIGQNMGWRHQKLRDPFANYIGPKRNKVKITF